jgi:hypothetical protein
MIKSGREEERKSWRKKSEEEPSLPDSTDKDNMLLKIRMIPGQKEGIH